LDGLAEDPMATPPNRPTRSASKRTKEKNENAPQTPTATSPGRRPKLMPVETPDYMAEAWLDCLRWAVEEPSIVAAFTEATGHRWTAPRNGIERAIDDATGAGKKYIEAFVTWYNENVWGKVE
jgi:hypothetical protein